MIYFKLFSVIVVLSISLNAYERQIDCWELESQKYSFRIGVENKKYLAFYNNSLFSQTIATFYRTDISKKTDNTFDMYKKDDNYAFVFQRYVNEGQYNSLSIFKKGGDEKRFLCKELE